LRNADAMKHLFILIFTINILSTLECFSQSDTIILSLSEKDEKTFECKLSLLESKIKILLHPSLHSIPDSSWLIFDGNIQDGTIIKMKSGLIWKIGDLPPEKPPFFMITALSEKGRQKPEVVKRLHYHQLVNEFVSNQTIDKVEVNSVVKDSLHQTQYRVKFILVQNSTGGWEIKEKYYQVIQLNDQ